MPGPESQSLGVWVNLNGMQSKRPGLAEEKPGGPGTELSEMRTAARSAMDEVAHPLPTVHFYFLVKRTEHTAFLRGAKISTEALAASPVATENTTPLTLDGFAAN